MEKPKFDLGESVFVRIGKINREAKRLGKKEPYKSDKDNVKLKSDGKRRQYEEVWDLDQPSYDSTKTAIEAQEFLSSEKHKNKYRR